jgi:hypothetical protein
MYAMQVTGHAGATPGRLATIVRPTLSGVPKAHRGRMTLTLSHVDRAFDQATRTARSTGGDATTGTASRCDQIIALIDACLADLGPSAQLPQSQADWSATEPTECSR